ncbi:MAG: pyridoxamine 5'-phosphate oxidase [Myxococcaceae bacterium]|nr:pyridoxamine 5'-phosphate oxidase [Myxococcaceae bacterium]
MLVPLEVPFHRFAEVFDRAKAAHPKDPNAVVLSTVDQAGRPSSRVVLLKGFDGEGFVIFTNYESRKGKELTGQRAAALCFYWPETDEQVRVEGAAQKVTAAESDEYFATRARGSQLGAWASLQSQVLTSRDALDQRLAAFEKKYEGQGVPRPPHWGGFRIKPTRIEFWKARESRLHDREVYVKAGEQWDVSLLNP